MGSIHAKMCLMPYANNKGADQPAHPRSLISTFVVRCLDSIMPLVSISEISRLKLVAVAEQTGLSHTRSKISEDTFSRDVTQPMTMIAVMRIISSEKGISKFYVFKARHLKWIGDGSEWQALPVGVVSGGERPEWNENDSGMDRNGFQ